MQRYDKIKTCYFFYPVQKRKTNWTFTGCQMPHFMIVLIPFYQVIKPFLDKNVYFWGIWNLPKYWYFIFLIFSDISTTYVMDTQTFIMSTHNIHVSFFWENKKKLFQNVVCRNVAGPYSLVIMKVNLFSKHNRNGLLYSLVGQVNLQLKGCLVCFFCIIAYYRNSYKCKPCRPWSDAALCGVWSGSTWFAHVF